MSDYIGLKLGNYRISRLIGRGGFAKVYLGEHIYLKTPAAIKVLNMQLMNNGLENFLAEARTIALLEHPHIVRVMEFGVEGITPFLVMNYAEHGTVRDHYPRNTRLPRARIISYIKQVADALQYAHDCGVIHRDIKPENILLGKKHLVQLSDFGLALIVQNMQTHPSGGAGTTAYMAPEQLQGNPCPASDQYALGVVVYEWLSGIQPFTGSEREITLHHLYTPPAPINKHVPEVSPDVEQVVMRALAKNPQERFASIYDFVQALEQAFTAETLLDTEKGNATVLEHASSNATLPLSEPASTMSSEGVPSHAMQQQERVGVSPSNDLLTQLPIMVRETLPARDGRILQPSLGLSIYSVEETELPFASSSQLSAPTAIPSLPPHTPQPQKFPDIVKQVIPQAQIQNPAPQRFSRSSPLTALIGMAIIGITIVAGIFVWAQFSAHAPLSTLTQRISTVTAAANNTANKTNPTSTPIHQSTVNTSNSPSQAGTKSGTTPIPTIVPTPSTKSTPPVSTPLPSPQPTLTQVVPLTVAITNSPSSAQAGSIIMITVQASEGGVTIKLTGKVRFFGQQIANSQGAATFLIKVPALGKKMILTATATDTHGQLAQSGSVTIVIV